jgi:hypothetical protein
MFYSGEYSQQKPMVNKDLLTNRDKLRGYLFGQMKGQGTIA